MFQDTVAVQGLAGSGRSFVRRRAGRLVEVHVRRFVDVGDVARLQEEIAAAISLAGPRSVVCEDHRQAFPLSPEVADVWCRAMRRNNRAVALSALLLHPANAMYNLQIERVVRVGGEEHRSLPAHRRGSRLDWGVAVIEAVGREPAHFAE